MNSSHAAPRNENRDRVSTESLILADAFAEFISASSRLETFYGDLQKEVSQLGQELTERNAALHAGLVQSEEARRTLQLVMEALPCALVVADEAGCLSLFNQEADRLLHIANDQHLYQDGAVPLPAGLLRAMHESVATGQERDYISHARDSHHVIGVCSRLVQQGAQAGAAAEPGQMVAVMRDISRQREIDNDYIQRHKGRVLAEVADALAQEIRSPLASIEMFADLIAKEKGDVSRWIAHLRTSTRALSDTLHHAIRF